MRPDPAASGADGHRHLRARTVAELEARVRDLQLRLRANQTSVLTAAQMQDDVVELLAVAAEWCRKLRARVEARHPVLRNDLSIREGALHEALLRGVDYDTVRDATGVQLADEYLTSVREMAAVWAMVIRPL